VAVESKSAIKALVDTGADVLRRNGCDPYEFDRRVRVVGSHIKGPNLRRSTVPNTYVLGLSALDYAAMNHDPFIFEHLLNRGHPVDINSVDE
jgi:hypothetical protein